MPKKLKRNAEIKKIQEFHVKANQQTIAEAKKERKRKFDKLSHDLNKAKEEIDLCAMVIARLSYFHEFTTQIRQLCRKLSHCVESEKD